MTKNESSQKFVEFKEWSEIKIENCNQLETLNQAFKEQIQLLLDKGLLDQVKVLIAQYEEIKNDDIDMYSIKGIVKMMEGDIDEAERIFCEGLNVAPENFDLMYNLGYLYEGTYLNCPSLAIYYYNRCISVTKKEALKRQLEEQINLIKENINLFQSENKPLVSIVVLAYNKLEYTKMCIQSLLKYTKNIDYELITVDNGSSDGTKAFFQSLGHQKKIELKNNVGCVLGFNAGLFAAEGEYLVYVGNDLILTPHWLDNLLTCIKSDKKIGFVAPGANILSNHQAIEVNYTNIEEMFVFAEKYNISNPRKWEERLRNMPLTMVIRREVFYKTGGFDHRYYLGEFADDDISFVVRRLGYKIIYAGDTFVHHFGSITGKEFQKNKNSLDVGRRFFVEKFGIDSWTEAVFDYNLVESIDIIRNLEKQKILGINCFCGGTPLQLKNKLVKNGIKDIDIISYTSNPKYKLDLETISLKTIVSDWEQLKDDEEINDINYMIIESKLGEIADLDSFFENIRSKLASRYRIIIKLDNPSYYGNIYKLFNNGTALKETSYNVDRLMDKLEAYDLGRVENLSLCEGENSQNTFLKEIVIQNKKLSTVQVNKLRTQHYLLIIKKD